MAASAEGPIGLNYSPECSNRILEDELYIIDWAVQAEGCALMYRQTGDTDWELRRIEAEEKARRQRELFDEIQGLESHLSAS